VANKVRRAIKYLCLGYIQPGKFQGSGSATRDVR
jgi:hypothetical protein